MITVHYFGRLSDIAKSDKQEFDLFPTVKDLKTHLENRFTELGNECFQVAVNQHFVDESHKLKNGDLVALLPPFAGG